MKKLIAAFCAMASLAAFADIDDAERDRLAEEESPIFWGFGNYGLYSGYQLYGSLINPEPTLQGYAEINANLAFEDWNLGYLGVGVWSNTDLTDRRRDCLGKAFNEWDFNIHYGFTYWFDDEKSWGLEYRTSVIWYYYPHRRHDHINGSIPTTMDWNHSFKLLNPYVVPFLDWVHEYHEANSDLLQFGLLRVCPVTDDFSLTPSIAFVYRDHRYNWCFPTAGFKEYHNGGLATGKIQLDANYDVNENFGFFAKVAFCTTLDPHLRDAAEHGCGGDYGKYKDFAWGGIGVTFKF